MKNTVKVIDGDCTICPWHEVDPRSYCSFYCEITWEPDANINIKKFCKMRSIMIREDE